MKRRKLIESAALLSGIAATNSLAGFSSVELFITDRFHEHKQLEYSSDLVIAGRGLGGCAAALSALRNNLTVVITEETDWIGLQMTSQGVPPDEHRWIETHGSTALYRELLKRIRNYYKNNYPLTEDARTRENLNPVDGAVSGLCGEPRVALAVLKNMMAPYVSTGKLTILTEHKISSTDTTGDKVHALKAVSQQTGMKIILRAPYFVDATE